MASLGNPNIAEAGKRHRFKKGRSGNVSGRPKYKCLSDAYRFQLQQPVPGDPEGRTWGELLAEAMIRTAVKGNVNAAREVAERTEGKAPQHFELVGRDRGPVKVSLEETLEKIRGFYGLGPDTTVPRRASWPESGSHVLNREEEPPEEK
jgi:hypothetical protein